MKHHRFYINQSDRELRHELWIDDQHLVHQWHKVLRYKVGDELVLFDGEQHERLYRVDRIEQTSFKLQHVTDLVIKRPAKQVYLFWSVLKKDKNEFVIQKCTELGVSNFIPIITERSEAKQVDHEPLHKISIEAAEQCGRGDVPTIHEPMSLTQALSTYTGKLHLYLATIPGTHGEAIQHEFKSTSDKPQGVFIGPEGGFSDIEITEAQDAKCEPIYLSEFVLRAETASIIASSKLMAA